MKLTVTQCVQHAVINAFLEGKLSEVEACERLQIHRSTLYRKALRISQQGPQGLIHRLSGRESNSSLEPMLKEQVLKRWREDFAPYGFRVAHFYQEAASSFPQSVAYSTVLRWLKHEGLVRRSRRGWKHRTRRPRREAFGELIQMDTSIHDWLGWGKNLALISNMDDATNLIVGAHLTHQDTTLANMTVLKQTIQNYGLFASLYVDRAPVFKVTRTGEGGVVKPTFKAKYQTQIQRALQELGIELIFAYSPQAKGRIERSFSTWQSRLIPELRQKNIREIDQANAYIQEVFVPKHNARFANNPNQYPSAFVPLLETNLDFILAERHPLTVSNDHIVASKHAGISLKILPTQYRLSFAKAKVDVFKHTDGSLSVLYQNNPIPFQIF